MKLTKTTAALVMLLSIGLVACDKDTINDSMANGNVTGSQALQQDARLASPLSSILQQGNWRITSYIDDGKDETAGFAGYIFTFRNEGLLTAENTLTQLRGSWSINTVEREERLFIRIPTTLEPFSDLSDEWEVIEMNETRVELRDVSEGGTDILVFERNS